jgi:hypothetical protein
VNYQQVLTGDFNGDGRTDFAAWEPNSGNWAEAFSSSAGFTSQLVAQWAPTDRWEGVAVGDFLHTGYDDIAGFDATTGVWHMLVGSANGLLPDQQFEYWNPSVSWQNVTTGDFYQTGSTDILGFDASTGNWHVIAFTGGVFQDRIVGNWNPAENWQVVGVGDFWGNGQGMLLGFDPASGNWIGTWATGTGTATAYIQSWTPGHTYADLHLQKITGGSNVEVLGFDTSTGRWIASGSVAGRLQTQPVGNWDPTVNWQNVMWGDLNSDGVADIVGLNPATGTWTGLMSGASGFTTQQLGAWPTLNNYVDVQLADPAGTGALEIIGRDRGTWNWFALGQTATGFQTQTLTATTPTGSNWQYTQTADLQGDNSGDLIGWNASTGDWWATLWTGAESSSQKIAHWDPSANWEFVTTADYYGNGRTDILGFNATTGDWHVISYNGSTFQDRIVGNWNPELNWQFAGVGDIWGNGQKAIVGLDPTTNEWWATWAVGAGTTTAPLQGWATGTQYAYLHLQDTNGDGRMDWVGFDQTSGQWTAGYWSPGTGIVSKGLGVWSTTVNWTDVGWADVNGDGLPDIFGYNPATRSWTFLMSSAGGTYAQQSIFAPLTQSNWGTFLVGDINGDGHAELLGFNSSNGNWQALMWNNGVLSLQTIGKWSANGNWSQVQLADVNGDGIADVVGFDTQSNSWSVLTDISGQFTTSKITWAAGTNYTDLEAGAVPGLSNAMLRRQILQQIPGLASALASSPLTAANLLLNWTANAADFAIDPQFLLQSPTSAADAYYNYFQTDAAGESCGGYAWFYSAILKLFNIDSLDVAVGVNGTDLTHVFVVIPEKQNGSWKFYVFDPTFNLTFSTPTSTFADYFQLMDYENTGRSNQITVNQGSLAQRHFLAPSPQSPATFTPVKVTGGTYVYTDANYGLTSFLATWQPLMQQYGYPTNVTGYLQFLESYVLSVSSTSSDPTTRNAFVSQLQAYGIPYSGN